MMHEKEKWAEVDGYPSYHVSNAGRVKRVLAPKRGRAKAGDILCHRYSSGVDYPSVLLANDQGRKNFYVHRLVAMAFLGEVPFGKEVNHIDGDKNNCKASNLEYLTRSENMKHAFEKGLNSSAGERNNRSILSREQVEFIKSEYSGEYGHCAILARKFEVSHSSVQDIIHGRSWQEINGTLQNG